MPTPLNALQPRGEFHIAKLGMLTAQDIWRAVNALPCRHTQVTVRAAILSDSVEALPPHTLRAMQAAVRAVILKGR